MPPGYRRGCAPPQCPYWHSLAQRPLRSSSLLGRGAAPRPRPNTRAPRGISCCKPVSVCMRRPAIGGGGPIGIVTCNGSGKELHAAMSPRWIAGSSPAMTHGWPAAASTIRAATCRGSPTRPKPKNSSPRRRRSFRHCRTLTPRNKAGHAGLHHGVEPDAGRDVANLPHGVFRYGRKLEILPDAAGRD
jgi:hypothetical protein